jgi:DNA-directed RNA polymerase specialized sigma24 family protein
MIKSSYNKNNLMALSDNELIIKTNKGDVLALEELIYRYDKKVLRLAIKFTGNSDDAKDSYLEVFIECIRVWQVFKLLDYRS